MSSASPSSSALVSGGRSYGGSGSAPSSVSAPSYPCVAQRHDGLQPGQPRADDDDHGGQRPRRRPRTLNDTGVVPRWGNKTAPQVTSQSHQSRQYQRSTVTAYRHVRHRIFPPRHRDRPPRTRPAPSGRRRWARLARTIAAPLLVAALVTAGSPGWGLYTIKQGDTLSATSRRATTRRWPSWSRSTGCPATAT